MCVCVHRVCVCVCVCVCACMRASCVCVRARVEVISLHVLTIFPRDCTPPPLFKTVANIYIYIAAKKEKNIGAGNS